jgi:PEP-CTERM motif
MGGLGVQPASAVTIFNGNLVVSSLTYTGNASTVMIGQTLPGGGTAIANGSYPNVFANDTVDPSFGVTAPYSLQVFQTGNHNTTATLTNTVALPSNNFVGSFSSKSEGALNLSTDGKSLTLMGYVSTPNQLDVSNSNTPGHVDPTNPVMSSAPRAVEQINYNGSIETTPVNIYSGNNGRAAILANGQYYTVGNAGNGSGNQPANIINNTGVQLATPGTGQTTKVGTFSVTQVGDKADKAGKDDNYRGETIFNNTLYVTKGSGSNGIDTVYQVGAAGTLPTAGDAASTQISILPGFSTSLAKSNGDGGFFPFGIWFANASTLYVADEGDGTMDDPGTDANAGLEKWSLVGGTWKLDYTLQNGLGLGVSYGVAGYPTNLDPMTDGLRNITGQINADGTVTIYGVTSTVSANGDQGADPNRLVAINDLVADTALPTNESFSVLETAGFGQVLRGVSLAPVPEPETWAMMLMGFGGLGALLRSARRRQASLTV